MKTDSFTGIIDENGKHPLFSVWLKYVSYFLLCRKGKLIELPQPHVLSQKRTDKQNRYYWGLIGLLVTFTGYTKDEFHDGFGQKFRKKIIVVGTAELETIQSTTDMDTVEMADYIEKIRDWQRTYLIECYLPTPKEWEEWERGEYANAA